MKRILAFLLWRLLAFLICRSPATEEIFGRAMNLVLQARGWELIHDVGAGGLRWKRSRQGEVLSASLVPVHALAFEFRSGHPGPEYTFQKPPEVIHEEAFEAYKREGAGANK